MSESFVTVKNDTGAEAFLKVDANGATVVIPNSGAINIDSTVIQSIVDARKGFDYAELRKKIRLSKKTTGKVSVLNEIEEEALLQVVDLVLNTSTDNPLISVRDISTDTGSVEKVELNAQLSSTLLNMITNTGYTSDYPTIADILYVDVLPNETAADSKAVYLWKKEYYKLNAAEDGYDKLTGKFEEVADLYPFTTTAKENVLYNLTARFTSKWNELFEPGIYTYTAATNKAVLTELTIQTVKKLPELTAAKDKVIYVLNKDDAAVEGATKGTAWTVDKSGENPAWVKETREIITTSTVPFSPLAVKDTYYIVNTGIVKQAGTSAYTTIGNLVSVRPENELPSVEKVVLQKDVMYVLTKTSGEKKAGSKWMFDFDTKEFVEYESLLEQTTGEAGGQPVNPSPANP